MTECGVMDVSPSLRIEDGSFDVDNPKFLDLVDFATFSPADFGSLEDLVEQKNNEVDLGNQTWNTFGVYADSLPQANFPPIYRESETSDKMWGAGQTFTSIPDTKITTKDDNGMFYNVFCKSESPDQSYKSEAIDTSVTDGLTLFSALLNEKPVDLISSQSHRSPGSDCVSYVSASAFSDSGISTTLDENASPGEPIDVENMLHPGHLESMYTPADDLAGIEPYQAYLGPADGTSTILESVLRGTVSRRGQNVHQLPPLSQKTLTVMNNMNPLPPINTAFKNGSLAAMPTQLDMINTSTILNANNSFITNHISNNNHIINSTNNYYEYLQQPTLNKDYSSLDISVKIAPVPTSTTSYHSDEPRPKKRKYTKRGTAEESTSKGRLLHFCSTCNKGFKDKYSVNVHLRTHTGEKPFLCNQCGKAFRQKAHLAKHVQIHLTGQKTPNKR